MREDFSRARRLMVTFLTCKKSLPLLANFAKDQVEQMKMPETGLQAHGGSSDFRRKKEIP